MYTSPNYAIGIKSDNGIYIHFSHVRNGETIKYTAEMSRTEFKKYIIDLRKIEKVM